MGDGDGRVAGGKVSGGRVAGPRAIALVGPFASGKTTLLEALLARTGAVGRQGSVAEKNTVGDGSPEARAHQMSVELNVAEAEFMGDRLTILDCPGSVEFALEAENAVPAVDLAIVVAEADPKKIPALQLILKMLEDRAIPRVLFLNKMDKSEAGVEEALRLLQQASAIPLVLRHIPTMKNGAVSGFIDLALERAFTYRERAPSEVVVIPEDAKARGSEARYAMLEKLADYDDALMEELISDIEPPRDQVFDDLSRELREGLIVPMLIGSAERGNGVTRLLKALRHETPNIAQTRARLGVPDAGAPIAQVARTIHTAHGGKLSVARVLRGAFNDGATVAGAKGGEDRIASLSRMIGSAASKVGKADEGDTLAFGRLDHIASGETFGDAKSGRPQQISARAATPQPVHSLTLAIKDRKDEVKLAAAMAKLTEEDPSLVFTQDQESGEMKLAGQGEMHLRVALERLAARFGVTVEAKKSGVAYRETIRHAAHVRGRHKKQSGGHGQFGDVVLEVRALDRGAGFLFEEKVHGGAVPRQYFSSVESGCRDACAQGPLGFPVVDVAATLVDGSYHTVDSSDMAFRTAARIGMSEALEKSGPVLLEPILAVSIAVPTEAMSRATAIVSGRRGQILGFDGRPGWEGWDVLEAQIPEAEMGGLIVDLRSATSGVGSYTAKFDHLAEVVGKHADAIVAARASEKVNGH